MLNVPGLGRSRGPRFPVGAGNVHCVLVSGSQLALGEEKSRLAAFATFHGVRVPTVMGFRLSR